ncbi:hypothetical protein PILCRDRAFT_827661 [Piloderma croceum F 1598]|uniref:Uncharacterized protein n=1 Tax=Piloderma croceum (strain F 1598) TaxID=765440 RepID=A0A0C3ERB6_PILCF|nr:hypothetical protein PILCRDRAFT_827661 [Piloderma croceum F 1598]
MSLAGTRVLRIWRRSFDSEWSDDAYMIVGTSRKCTSNWSSDKYSATQFDPFPTTSYQFSRMK